MFQAQHLRRDYAVLLKNPAVLRTLEEVFMDFQMEGPLPTLFTVLRTPAKEDKFYKQYLSALKQTNLLTKIELKLLAGLRVAAQHQLQATRAKRKYTQYVEKLENEKKELEAENKRLRSKLKIKMNEFQAACDFYAFLARECIDEEDIEKLKLHDVNTLCKLAELSAQKEGFKDFELTPKTVSIIERMFASF